MTSRSSPPTDSIAKNHVRGSLLLVSGRLIALVINFVVQVVTVRYLGKADFGVFALAISISTVASVCCAVGMDKVASRFLPVYLQDKDYGKFWGVLISAATTVVIAGLAMIGVFASLWWWNINWFAADSRSMAVIAIVIGISACDALDCLFVSLFAVLASPSAIFWRRHLLGPLLRLLAAVLVAGFGGGLYAFASGQLIASFLGLSICVALLARILAKHEELRPALHARQFVVPFREIYSFSATLLAGDLSFLLRSALVPIVLGLLFVSEEVAAYQAVLPLARLNEVVLMTFSILFLPSAARLAASSKHVELQSLFENTTTWITLLSLPLFAASFMGADLLPVLVFGKQYADSSSILAWLALAYFANASLGINLRLLRAMGQLKVLLAVDALMVAIAVGLVAWFVPRYGALGGAWAVCGTYLVQALMYQAMVARFTPVNPFTRRSLTPFAVGIVMCMIGSQLNTMLHLPPVAGLAGAAIVTCVALWLFRHQLELAATFPELTRLPVIGRWLVPVSLGSNS